MLRAARSGRTWFLLALAAFVLAAGPFPEPSPADGVVLLGDQNVEPALDYNPPGVAEAFRTTASVSASVFSLTVYVDAGSTGAPLVAGLYNDVGGHPATLLAKGSVSAPVASAWNTVAVPATQVTAGTVYWITVLSPSGTLRYRDRCCGAGTVAETHATRTLSTLPSTWTTGTVYRDGPLSAYGSSAAASGPVLSVTPSSLSFTATQGGADPAPAQLAVANAGTGSLAFTAGVDAPWLFVAPGSGSAPQTLQVSASVAGLAAGSYSGHVTVTATGAQGSPANVTVALTVSSPPPSASQVGSWDGPYSWPLVAVHSSVLPTGNVLVWDGFAAGPNSQRIWNPITTAFTPVPYGVNTFCSGHILLADGRFLVAGGHASSDVGITDTSIYDPRTGVWTAAAKMTVARWYPTVTELADGRVLAFSGDNIVTNRSGQPPAFKDAAVNSLPEVFDPVKGTWMALTGSRLTSVLYPYMFVLSDGRVLDAGPDTTTRLIDPATWSWSTLGTSQFDGASAVMYRPDKIMKAGAWADPDFSGSMLYQSHGRTAVLDMTQPSPAWRETAAMQYRRSYLDLTVLPDGNVLASGGMTTSDGVDLTKAVLPAELWNPDTETWTTMAAEQVPREYHSTALLLPDGRVLVAGGGQFPAGSATNETNAEVYSPPYLFKGSRPTVSGAPSLVQYGSAFTVTTPDAASIASVSLIRTPSVTHSFDQNQRFQRLPFTVGSGSLSVSAPASSKLAPPGYYMLFLVNTSGVPSVASFVRLPAPWEDSQPPTAPSTLTAAGGIGKVSLAWNPSTDNVGVLRYDVYRSTTAGFTAGAANRIAQPTGTSYTDVGVAAGTYYYQVQGEDAAGNLSPSSNEASATAAADTTSPTVAITAPAAGATVSGITPLTATASDNVAVAGVQFQLDGANLGSEVLTPPYSMSWNTTLAANGSHKLNAVARDAANNTTTSSDVLVTVSNAPNTGLVAAYSFNQGSGTTIADASGNGNTGTVANTTWTAAGKYGAALTFNGSSSWVTVPDSSSLHLSTGMTIEAWVKPSTLGIWRDVVFKEQSAGMVYSLYANDGAGHPIGQVYNAGAEQNAVGTAPVSTTAWTHLAVTYDGSVLALYVNGSLVRSVIVVGAIASSTGVLHIGGNSVWSEWFAGQIDEIRIYSRALTASAIQTDMNTPLTP